MAPIPPGWTRGSSRGLAGRGIERAVHPPGGGDRRGPRRRGRRRRHADGVGQDAVLRAARPPGHRRGPGRAGAVPVPDQGARPGPGRRVRASSPAPPACQVAAAAYDGDTPAPIRSAIRTAGQVVVTNPDMLHSAILPHHTKWFQLFEQLRVIVIDELHTYRGVFGSHVANVLRRLLRLCAPLRLQPDHRLLLGDDREPARARRACSPAGRRGSSTATGRPSGERHVLLVDPPVIDPATGARGSAADARPALGAAVPARRAPDDRLRAVAGRRRDHADRPARGAARGPRAAVAGPRLSRRLPAHRAAVDRARAARRRDPRRRRDERARARRRHRRGSTSSILAGYPGSIAGDLAADRSRRPPRRRASAILVASAAPVDQYVIHHPEFLLERTPEEARLDPDNLHVLLAHLRCATFELPFEPGEVFGPGPGRRPARVPRRGGPRPPGRRRPLVLELARTSRRPRSRLRTAAPENVVIIDTTPDRPRVLGEVDLFCAQVLVHEQRDLHPRVGPVLRGPARVGRAKAYVHRIDVDHYTYANRAVTLKPLDVFAEAAGDRRAAGPRRGDGRQPRHPVQEAEVRHRRERRLGPHRPARAGAPDDGLLADRRGRRRSLAPG